MDLVGYFSDIEDYRMASKCNYLLSDILLIDLCAYLSGGEDYEEIEFFAENHYDFVKEYCQFPNGIPYHDTFSIAFNSLNTNTLNQHLENYGKLKHKNVVF